MKNLNHKMKNKFAQYGLVALFASMCFVSANAFASGGGVALKKIEVDMTDYESLKRGAKTFTSYCLSCHGARFVRFNRVAEDLQMSEEEVMTELNHLGVKFGSPMEVTMNKDYAKKIFGAAPPDLSLVSRSRGDDWLYTYLTGFYKDPARKTGFNNVAFNSVAMPNVLWQLQGTQVASMDEHGHVNGIHLETPGTMSEAEFDATIKDLVNFLSYMGEPRQHERKILGMWVLGFLFILFCFAYALKKEFWKDVH